MEEQSKTDCNTGIYLITHIATGIPYVGLTGKKTSFEGRWEAHRKALRADRGNPKFQNYWNKYGEEAFSFSIHTYISQGDLTYLDFRKFLEQEEIRILQLYPENLNGTSAGNGGMTHLPEVKEKIKNANLEKMKDPKYRAKKISDINNQEGTAKKIASNKSPRIRAMRSAQMSEQMQNNPKLKAARIASMHTLPSQEKANIGKRAKWADPEWSIKMKTTLAFTNNTPEVREKKRLATKAQWADPEMRAKRIEINKRAGATRKARRLAKLHDTLS